MEFSTYTYQVLNHSFDILKSGQGKRKTFIIKIEASASKHSQLY